MSLVMNWERTTVEAAPEWEGRCFLSDTKRPGGGSSPRETKDLLLLQTARWGKGQDREGQRNPVSKPPAPKNVYQVLDNCP